MPYNPTARDTAAPGIPGPAEFRADVVAGLSAPRKTLAAKYFYDAEGSRLFDRICGLPEYYPTRTELDILRREAGAIAHRAGKNARLVEFGAGSLVKVRILLDALDLPAAYVPIDISADHLMEAAQALARDYPALDVVPLVGDFTRRVALPQIDGQRTVGFFPGSTIGNFTPSEARRFLVEARLTLGTGALLVLGVDLKKDVRRLEAAYDDAEGVTAAFNLNLLARINRELDGNFDLDRFAHAALFNEEESRIEMHLVSRADQIVRAADRTFRFAAGETIHTENSYKYASEDVAELARAAGWHTEQVWTDAQTLFGVFLLSA
ncbi:L-histidine N(alpha)-methyltransferase [Aquabacter spiritensis]|uniref:Dimethylhistidine N-methyltransferase n=1 Tax=Aquabacter spiritensis TaxID=933073 RepID=A0A4V2UYK3_9HYPH|nr:L-histidine N(alpha)-methyltransferase [Aquabacter spiritensis]TCT07758.1 dimethylhistidine N-methyltransferase [Aquabacter spiritensis]